LFIYLVYRSVAQQQCYSHIHRVNNYSSIF